MGSRTMGISYPQRTAFQRAGHETITQKRTTYEDLAQLLPGAYFVCWSCLLCIMAENTSRVPLFEDVCNQQDKWSKDLQRLWGFATKKGKKKWGIQWQIHNNPVCVPTLIYRFYISFRFIMHNKQQKFCHYFLPHKTFTFSKLLQNLCYSTRT